MNRVIFSAAAALSFAATSASAQHVDLETAIPASPGDGALLDVQSSQLAPRGRLALGLYFQLVDDPLVEADLMTGERIGAVVDSRLGADIAVAYGLGSVEVFAGVPLVLRQTSDGDIDAAGAESAGLGDARLGARARVLGRGALSLAAALTVGLPTAMRAEYTGADGPSLAPVAIAQWKTRALLVAVNGGARLRETRALGDLEVGSAFVYGAGAAYRSPPGIDLIGEVAGEVAGRRLAQSPVELRGGVRWRVANALAITAGYGRGLVDGYGAPDHRVFAMLAYRSEPDAPAPIAPIAAAALPAPDPEPDPDGDGIRGALDACPDQGEDFDGFEDTDGCPDTDNDGDGVADQDDQCANDPEDADGWRNDDGCPDPDNDFDGILDADDACPDVAEIINGVDDDDGCPDEGKQLVTVEKTQLRIHEQLYFANDRDVILPRSEAVLDQLAKTLVRKPWLERIRIEGHTDSNADDAYNLDLSQRRADSVRRALVDRGVAPERLEAKGYGEQHPIDVNSTVAGRANNRRVEFHIVAQDAAPDAEVSR